MMETTTPTINADTHKSQSVAAEMPYTNARSRNSSPAYRTAPPVARETAPDCAWDTFSEISTLASSTSLRSSAVVSWVKSENSVASDRSSLASIGTSRARNARPCFDRAFFNDDGPCGHGPVDDLVTDPFPVAL